MKKILAVLLAIALALPLAGCGEERKVTPISAEKFTQSLESCFGWEKGLDFFETDSYPIETCTIENGSLLRHEVNVNAIQADFPDLRMVYCTFDSNEEAEASFYSVYSNYMPTEYSVGSPGSNYRCEYAPGEPSYILIKLSNCWDAYYYFDNVVIYVLTIDDSAQKLANTFLKEIGYPKLALLG